jgi:hypothetical protein
VLNLFLALLLSSFGAESLKHSQEDSEPNKLQEAVDRINRFAVYVRSKSIQFIRDRCGGLHPTEQPVAASHDSLNSQHRQHGGARFSNNILLANCGNHTAISGGVDCTADNANIAGGKMPLDVTVALDNWSRCRTVNGRSNDVNFNMMTSQNNHGGLPSDNILNNKPLPIFMACITKESFVQPLNRRKSIIS